MKLLQPDNKIKIYDLSASRAIPEWLPDRKKRQMRKKNPEIRKQLDLIQDLEMPNSTDHLAVSPDQRYLVVLGVYKPRIRCYELDNLSLKFERGLDSKAHKVEFVDSDYSKFALLEDDRWIEVHAKGGYLHRCRVPKPGRDMLYIPSTCDLLICGVGNEIHRLNLDRGQFVAPLESQSDCLLCCDQAVQHSLVLCGTEDGKVEAWDPRAAKSPGALDIARVEGTVPSAALPQVTSIRFRDPLTYGVGTSSGRVHLFDLRSSKPWLSKDMACGRKNPVRWLGFHDSKVLSMNQQLLKIWTAGSEDDAGQDWINIQPGDRLNHMHHFASSGLLMFASEVPKVQSFFVPMLGPAPRWCYRLDRIVTEYEPALTSSGTGGGADQGATEMYEGYQFVTVNELDAMGIGHLVGSRFLRAFNHGYFIDSTLYAKAKAIAGPVTLEEQRKELIRREKELSRKSLLLPSAEEVAQRPEGRQSGMNLDLVQAVSDDRLKRALLDDPDFRVDPANPEYELLSLGQRRAEKRERRKVAKRERAVRSQRLAEGREEESEDEE